MTNTANITTEKKKTPNKFSTMTDDEILDFVSIRQDDLGSCQFVAGIRSYDSEYKTWTSTILFYCQNKKELLFVDDTRTDEFDNAILWWRDKLEQVRQDFLTRWLYTYEFLPANRTKLLRMFKYCSP